MTGEVVGKISGEHVPGNADNLIVVGAFNIGTGRSDPDESGKQTACVACSIIPANGKPPIMLILPEHTVVDFITQLMEAKGMMIRENPRKNK